MLHPGDGTKCCYVVAVFTDVGGGDVVDGLASRDGAVMAAEAVIHNACVIKPRWQPGNRSMAIITIGSGWNVPLWLAIRLAAIVATHALTKYLKVINPCYRRKAAGAVARFAALGAENMACRLITSTHAACLGMAAFTSGGRAGEHTVAMTSFAGHDLMCAVQAKAGSEVIKGRCDAGLTICRQHLGRCSNDKQHR